MRNSNGPLDCAERSILILPDEASDEVNGTFYFFGNFCLYIPGFLDHYDEVRMLFPGRVTSGPSQGHYQFDPGPIKMIPAPYYTTTWNSVLAIAKHPICFFKTVIEAIKGVDRVLARLPSLTGLLIATISVLFCKKVTLYVAGDARKAAAKKNSYFEILFQGLAAYVMDWWIIAIGQFSTVLVLSRELQQRYRMLRSRPRFTFTSLIREEDIRIREDRNMDTEVHLVTVGRLSPEKNFPLFIQVVSELKDNGCKVRGNIVCSQPVTRSRISDEAGDLEKIKDIIAEQGLTDSIDINLNVPYGPQLWDAYDKADVFLLTSTSEGAAKVLLEAMARGALIVATRVGGVPDLIQDGESGLLAESNDPKGLTKHILDLMKTPDRRQRIRTAAYAYISSHTFEKQIKHIVDLMIDTPKN